MSDLKPCPYCGAVDKHETEVDDQIGSVWIRCLGCGVTIWKWSYLDAVSAWNTRPLEDALEAEAETLRRRLETVVKSITDITDDAEGQPDIVRLEILEAGIDYVAWVATGEPSTDMYKLTEGKDDTVDQG
jgi:hypothetical protein